MPTPIKEITYKRYEYTSALVADGDTSHTGTLLTFVYDIPYFAACGVFPPLHIANQIFRRGEAGGGMSPGTSWKPFTVTRAEYDALVEAIRNTPLVKIQPHARYAFVKFKFDHSFDGIETLREWFSACCKKHRQAWHQELRDAGAMS